MNTMEGMDREHLAAFQKKHPLTGCFSVLEQTLGNPGTRRILSYNCSTPASNAFGRDEATCPRNSHLPSLPVSSWLWPLLRWLVASCLMKGHVLFVGMINWHYQDCFTSALERKLETHWSPWLMKLSVVLGCCFTGIHITLLFPNYICFLSHGGGLDILLAIFQCYAARLKHMLK